MRLRSRVITVITPFAHLFLAISRGKLLLVTLLLGGPTLSKTACFRQVTQVTVPGVFGGSSEQVVCFPGSQRDPMSYSARVLGLYIDKKSCFLCSFFSATDFRSAINSSMSWLFLVHVR